MSSTPRTLWTSGAGAYALSVLAVILATLLRLAMDPLNEDLPYITYFPAVVFATWLGGMRPALVTIVLSCVLADWLFVPPQHTSFLFTWESRKVIPNAAFLTISSVVAAFGESSRIARLRAERAADHQYAQSEWLRVTLASIGDGVVATDRDSRVQFMNPVAEKLTGWTAREATGRPLAEVFPIYNELTGAAAENPCRRALETGVIVGLANHTILVSRNGTAAPIDDSAAPIKNAAGQIIGVVLVFRDATEKRRTEEGLQRLAAIVQHSNDAIIGSTLEGIVTTWNLAAERLFGYTADEMIGRPLAVYVPADRRDELTQVLERLQRGEVVEYLESVRLRKDGTPVDVLLTMSPVKNGYGAVIGVSKLALDITARKAAERQKDEFLAMLAHELRNPLAAISYAAQVIRVSPESTPAAIDVVSRQVDQLSRLINDLLDVSRITQGKIRLQPVAVDLSDLARRAVEATQPLIAQQDHRLELNFATEPLSLWADATRMEQVIVNLLANAAKYTPRGGRVTVTSCRDDGQAVLQVADTGIGIPADMLPRIFDLFTQVDPGIERVQGGLGIGLHVVRRLVEMHGGTVTVASAGAHQGSEFTVRLPLSPASVRSGPAIPEGPRLRPGLKVLVVEDNLDAARALTALLEQAGCLVKTVHDGEAALETAAQFLPQAVLLDLGLPKINGYDVARRLREQPRFQETLLIAISGYGQEQDRQRAKAAGFDNHLTKPVELPTLLKLLSCAAGDA